MSIECCKLCSCKQAMPLTKKGRYLDSNEMMEGPFQEQRYDGLTVKSKLLSRMLSTIQRSWEAQRVGAASGLGSPLSRDLHEPGNQYDLDTAGEEEALERCESVKQRRSYNDSASPIRQGDLPTNKLLQEKQSTYPLSTTNRSLISSSQRKTPRTNPSSHPIPTLHSPNVNYLPI